MFIDKKSPVPAYYQLKKILIAKINKSEFPAGSPIPSERELSDTLNISRMTVRQALNELVTEGLLYREKGKGTFVSKPQLEQKNIMSFSDIVKLKGFEPTSQILEFKKEDASEALRQVLDLKAGEKVFYLKRLRVASGMPVGIEQNYIPEKFCPGLEHHDLTASLYNIFKTEYDYSISFVDHIIKSTKPDKKEKELLLIANATPVLKVTCINYADENLKLFYEESVYRSDEYQYNMRVYVNKSI